MSKPRTYWGGGGGRVFGNRSGYPTQRDERLALAMKEVLSQEWSTCFF